jgi:predicted patatin/cPLA2 family phospholipase
VKFFSNRRPEDVFEALRAAKAMPFIYGKVVNIENEYYCDSLLSASPTLLTEKAKDLGAEKILVLDNGKPNSVMKKGSDLWVSLGNPQFKRNYAAELRRLNGLHFDIPIFYLRPSENLQISALSHDHARLKQTVDMGYEDTIRNKDLKSFLEM